ncbi:aspartate aminotransferase family protein [Thermogladius sp. 4427co]|uniref:aspartate aminotransferase family protein n=1 Tax=Thermogladius sp. 4427co TaxID=3450718 RepID=UPI003F78C921
MIVKDRLLIPRPYVLKYFPFIPVKGRGCRLYDDRGREYIDATSGSVLFNIGFSHEEVIREVVDQVGELINYTALYFYNKPSIDLAEKLASITPGSFRKKVVYGFSGSDAVEIGLMASIYYSKKTGILSFTGSFHGTLYLPLSVSGIFSSLRDRLAPLTYANVYFAEYPNPYRNKWGIDGYENPSELAAAAIGEFEKIVRREGDRIAAVIIEPIQGDAGVVVPPPDFLREVRRISSEEGILLIADEAQTGLGRTGYWWAVEYFNVVPDVLVSAKALGGGFPLSAVVAREEILESLPWIGLGFTSMGHAVACRAALATIRVIEREGLVERARMLGGKVMKQLAELKNRFSIIGDVRGLGLMIGIEIVEDQASRRPSKKNALKVSYAAWRRGLIITTLGEYGNVLRFMPPLNIHENDLDKAINILEEALKDVVNGRVPDEAIEEIQGWGW